jgi:hypothetical protein
MNFRGFINTMYAKMKEEYCCYMRKPCCTSLDEYAKKNKWFLKRKYKEKNNA